MALRSTTRRRLIAAASLLGLIGSAHAQATQDITVVGFFGLFQDKYTEAVICLLYTSPSPRD